MIVKMAKCIGRAGCTGQPKSRGLCHACYERHSDNGTLRNYPTMRERLNSLRKTTGLRLTTTGADRSSSYRMRRYAERIVIDGYTVHPDPVHGRVTSYISFGCRGPMCRDAQTWYRDTGEAALPKARERKCTVDECVTYSGRYQR